MKRSSAAVIGILGAATLALTPAIAVADGGYSPWIYELVQHDEEVELSLALFPEGCPASWQYMDGYHSVKRRVDGETDYIIYNRQFTPSDADETISLCFKYYHPPGEYSCGEDTDVDTDTEPCKDCDGDGTAECAGSGFCCDVHLVSVWDGCAPPGKNVYTLTFSEDGEMEWGNRKAEIVVSDHGRCCGSPGQGCTSSGVGARSGTGLLFFMLGVVAWALGFSRRRR